MRVVGRGMRAPVLDVGLDLRAHWVAQRRRVQHDHGRDLQDERHARARRAVVVDGGAGGERRAVRVEDRAVVHGDVEDAVRLRRVHDRQHAVVRVHREVRERRPGRVVPEADALGAERPRRRTQRRCRARAALGDVRDDASGAGVADEVVRTRGRRRRGGVVPAPAAAVAAAALPLARPLALALVSHRASRRRRAASTDVRRERSESRRQGIFATGHTFSSVN
eukprot:29570-Pelagococcus_subviridis.AAC.14